MRLPDSLFFRTASVLIIAAFLLVTITLATAAYYVLIPVGKQSTDDLASFLILSAQTWVELPPETRHDLETELFESHQLRMMKIDKAPALQKSRYPYLAILKTTLEERLQQPVSVGLLPQEDNWFWVDIPMTGKLFRFGFHKERIGSQPVTALITIALSIFVLAIITGLILARRLTRPLRKLSRATSLVGFQHHQLSIDEAVPREITTLIDNFNRMSLEVSKLLENRTTLLAGISHDLRTPLTRLSLAIELLSGQDNIDLIEKLKKNVSEMEHLLEETMLLARGMAKTEPVRKTNLPALLEKTADHFRTGNQTIRLECETAIDWPVPEQVFRRVIENLLGNAVRYGEGNPIDITLQMENGIPLILIKDQGNGIPDDMKEAVFQPFFRLETSRNPQTGGSGLGLAIVKQLCMAQGWLVSLESSSTGGTIARLKLAET